MCNVALFGSAKDLLRKSRPATLVVAFFGRGRSILVQRQRVERDTIVKLGITAWRAVGVVANGSGSVSRRDGMSLHDVRAMRVAGMRDEGNRCDQSAAHAKTLCATKLRETLRWIARYWRHGIVVGDSHARFQCKLRRCSRTWHVSHAESDRWQGNFKNRHLRLNICCEYLPLLPRLQIGASQWEVLRPHKRPPPHRLL